MLYTLALYVENKSGVLARVAGALSGRGFNIDSLTVAKSLDAHFSQMTVVVDVDPSLIEQVMKQLSKLVNVVTVANLSEAPAVEREMLLVKVYLPADMRTRLLQEAEVFRARVVDAAPDSYTLEATGDPDKLEAFLRVLEHYGRLETARTGTVALLRGMNVNSRNGNGAKGAVPQGGPILI